MAKKKKKMTKAQAASARKEVTTSEALRARSREHGKEVRAHNPHTTLVYSMTPYDARLADAMKQESAKFNAALPDGIQATFKDVSIVEIGFAGNVLREIYRVSLEDGSAIDVATGKPVAR